MFNSYFVNTLFYANIVVLGVYLFFLVCFPKKRPRNLYFLSAIFLTILWRIIVGSLGYYQSRRYFLPATALLLLLLSGGIFHLCHFIRNVLLHFFLKRFPKNNSCGWLFIAAVLIGILSINLPKAFHKDPHNTEKKTISCIQKYLESANGNRTVLANAKIGRRLQNRIPAENVIIYSFDNKNDVSEIDIDAFIYNLALDNKDFILVLSDDVRQQEFSSKERLKELLGVFPFDYLTSVSGELITYSVFQYNKQIGRIGATETVPDPEAVILSQQSPSGLLFDLSSLMSSDEFAATDFTEKESVYMGTYWRLAPSSPFLDGKEFMVYICNVASWPVREYSATITKQENTANLHLRLKRQAEVKKAAAESCYYSINRIPKAFIPQSGGTVDQSNLLLSLLNSDLELTLRQASGDASQNGAAHWPGESYKAALTGSGVQEEWAFNAIHPRNQTSDQAYRILYVGCALEEDRIKDIFTQSVLNFSSESTIDYQFYPEIAFASLGDYEKHLEKALGNQTYDFVVLNIGANDFLWKSPTWNDFQRAFTPKHMLAQLFKKISVRYPGTCFAAVLPQLPAPGDAFFHQGSPFNWRKKKQGHHSLCNTLYEIEKDVNSSNFDVVPAFASIEKQDYPMTDNGVEKQYTYTCLLLPQGYQKVADAIVAWLAVKAEKDHE